MKLVSLVQVIFGIVQIKSALALPISSATSSKTQLSWGSTKIVPTTTASASNLNYYSGKSFKDSSKSYDNSKNGNAFSSATSSKSSKTELSWGSPSTTPASAKPSTSFSNSGASSPFSSSSSTSSSSSSWIPIGSSGGKSITDTASFKNRRNKYVEEFQCRLCPKKFVNRGNRTRHEESHRNVRNHECDRCGRKYVSSRNLLLHRLDVHKLIN